MISVFYWNSRGIGNGSTRRALRDLCRLHQPSLVCIAKPMVVFTAISFGFWSSLGLHLVGLNDKGSLLPTIWVFASDSFPDAQVVLFHEQQLTVSLTVNSRLHYYTFVMRVRRRLFEDRFSSLFGTRSVIEDCDFIGVRSQGARFTWARGRYSHTRIERRLDRALVSEGCISYWRDISCVALPRRFSNHCPLVIRLLDTEIVVISKLKRLKNALKTWNWEVFGDLNSNINGKLIELHSTQLQMSNLGFFEELFLAETCVHHELDVLLRRQECFYRDRSRVRWLQDGDRNSSFLHASTRRKQYRNALSYLSINGVLTDDRLVIRDHIIDYYSDLFSSDPSRVETDFSVVDDVIPSLVSDAENAFLIGIPSANDIHDAIFVMDAASAHGPDGFSRGFYQRCWEVMGSDVVFTVQDFFRTGVIFPGLNSNFIVLLPKLKDSISIDQFHLIMLSNFLLKISSKILADRLAQIVTRIVSPYQFGFIRDRHIEDCIALASDCVNVLHKKCYGGNLAMKIDIRKAFDTLDWSFLRRVFQAFGFSPIFMDWIDNILRSSRLSVMINGSLKGYFHCSRGVRQGDLLSPLLFSIAEDFLSRLLSRMVDFSQILPISSPRGFSTSTHLLYPDDVLIFYRGTVRNLKNIIRAFELYGKISGQLVNWGKSSIYFGSSISPSRIGRLWSLVDSLVWAHSRDGQVSCKSAYSQMIRGSPQVPWWRDVWCRFIPPSHSALTWRLLLDRLPTEDHFCKVGFHLASRCSVCGVSSESSDHLFLRCPLAAAL
ncbi:hypothetical protein LWI29_016439 [Acer saccharum]|uniref:Reverse transcriptase domain-containing protein n=1 Tax=Acer saccharum TaxID=4024 RepID=A0AA39TPZ9_ACESA|nr:hypothetical protein LWI29_016439 [Acer saccharum]